MSYIPPVPDVRWDLLGNLGKNVVDAYKTGRDISLDSDRRAALAALPPGASLQDIANVNLRSGDNAGAMAALGLSQTGAQNEASNRLQVLHIMGQRAQAEAQLAQSRAQAGVEPAPGGARIIPGGLQDPKNISAAAAAKDTRDPNEMNPTQMKLYNDAHLAVEHATASRDDLKRALELNPKIYSGLEAPIRTMATRIAPDWAPTQEQKDRVAATTAFDTLVRGSTLAGGKDYFGVRVTNYDEQLLQRLMADTSKTPLEREAILKHMIANRDKLIEEHTARRDAMKHGQFFQTTTPRRGLGASPDEGGDASAKPKPAAAPVTVPGLAAKYGEGARIKLKGSDKWGTVSGDRWVPE